MTTTREEIYKLVSNARSWEEIEGKDSDYYTNEIIKVFQRLIDTIEYEYDSEWHCQNAVDNAKDYLKEKLKE